MFLQIVATTEWLSQPLLLSQSFIVFVFVSFSATSTTPTRHRSLKDIKHFSCLLQDGAV